LFPRILKMRSGYEYPDQMAPFDSLHPDLPFAVFNALLEKTISFHFSGESWVRLVISPSKALSAASSEGSG